MGVVFRDKRTDRHDTVYLVDYHPYRCAGSRNPRFDENSARILALKRGELPALDWFYRQVDRLIMPGIVMAVVPSCDPATAMDAGIRKLAQRLAANGRIDGTDCLVRVRPIPKLATGGTRNIEQHLGSIDVHHKRVVCGMEVLLLDDVRTTGYSLEACRRLLLEAGAQLVKALALGQTVYYDD